jgi:Mlc titration factor MtfA (ptsG expression regulator)
MEVLFAILWLVFFFGINLLPGFRRRHLQKAKLSSLPVEEYLEDFQYYKDLKPSLKEEFHKRIRYLLLTKEFRSRHGLVLTEEMKVKILASMVQVTFGHRYFKLPAHVRIRVYPETFYYRLTKQWMKGFVAPRGVIAVSWEDFQKGYAINNDKYNLGLHEMAHALYLNNVHGYRSDRRFRRYFMQWKAYAVRHFEDLQKLNEEEKEFLRSYGGTNMHEFFAVVVESFFEAPLEFKKRLPKLFGMTALLLQQNPLNPENPLEGVPHLVPSKEAKRKVVRASNLSRSAGYDKEFMLASAGTLFMPIALAVLLREYRVSLPFILVGVLLCSLLGVVYFQWRKSSGIKYMPLFQLWFSVFGIGIYAFSILMLMNTLVTLGLTSEKHRINWDAHHRVYDRFSIANEDDYPSSAMKYTDKTVVRTIYCNPEVQPTPEDSLTLYFKRGLLGLERFSHNQVDYIKFEQHKE